MHAEVVQEWLTYKQAGKISGLSRTTLRKLAGEGSIRVRHIGRAVRINRESLDAFMRGDMEDGAPGPATGTK
jgi:excisionase family DNA binding protein